MFVAEHEIGNLSQYNIAMLSLSFSHNYPYSALDRRSGINDSVLWIHLPPGLYFLSFHRHHRILIHLLVRFQDLQRRQSRLKPILLRRHRFGDRPLRKLIKLYALWAIGNLDHVNHEPPVHCIVRCTLYNDPQIW